jgi:hypothetical protein
MVRVQHPKFEFVVYEVPAADLDEWLAAGWIALDKRTKPRRDRRNHDPVTPGE